jgi:Sulfotransferase family
MVSRPYFDMAAMMSRAEQATGLSDWGDDAFREPLRILLRALNEEAQLEAQGWARTKHHLDNVLAYRLRIFDDRKHYPGIVEQEIRQPLFITGLPRAGTSYLNAMLACDPANITPRHWQMWCPSPPANDPSIDHSAQIERARDMMALEGWQGPELRHKHAYDPMQAEEDLHIHEFSFITTAFGFFWDVPSYSAFVWPSDHKSAYRIEKLVLQAMQYGTRNKQWVLKTPDHLTQIESLLAVFPDARIVINHRDPSKVLSSTISLLAAHRMQFGNRPVSDAKAFAAGLVEALAAAMEHLIELRSDPKMNEHFLDVNYLELERAPVQQVERIYNNFGMTFSDRTREDLRRHVAENRKGKFGAHHYALADTGLRREEIYERFRSYIEHFDITEEPGD